MNLRRNDALLQRLEIALAKLPRRQREVFLACRIANVSFAEIAKRQGCSVRQVERDLTKAIIKIVKQLDGHRLSLWERWF